MAGKYLISIISITLLVLFLVFFAFTTYISFYDIIVLNSIKSIIRFSTYVKITSLFFVIFSLLIATAMGIISKYTIILKTGFKQFTVFLEICISLFGLVVGFLFIYGLLIEPNLPDHFFGLGDRKEMVYILLLSTLIVFLIFQISYIKTCSFYSGNTLFIRSIKSSFFYKTNLKKPVRLFPPVFFLRKYRLHYATKLDQHLVSSSEHSDKLNIISGLTIGGFRKSGYFFAWKYKPNEDTFTIFKVLLLNNKATAFQLGSFKSGESIEFSLTKKKNFQLEWKVAVLENESYEKVAESFSEIKASHLWGIEINGIENIVIRRSSIRKTVNTLI